MTAADVDFAVAALRRAGLAVTRQRMAVAGLIFGPPTIPASADELRERALDAGFCLSPEAAERSLAEFRQAGVLPQVIAGKPEPRRVQRAARLLQAMGNPHRLAVLVELARGERCVGDLLRVVGIGQSSLSQHLARLRADGVVAVRRDAQRLHYSLVASDAAAVLRVVAAS